MGELNKGGEVNQDKQEEEQEDESRQISLLLKERPGGAAGGRANGARGNAGWSPTVLEELPSEGETTPTTAPLLSRLRWP